MEILKRELEGKYKGYILQYIYNLKFEPLGIESMKKFKRIPRKISYFVHKDSIKNIYQYDLNNDYSKNHYYLELKDGSWKELVY